MREQSLIKIQVMNILQLRRGASSPFTPCCLSREGAATGFLDTEQITGSEQRRAAPRPRPHTYLGTAAHWLLAPWFVLALSACGGNDPLIPPFTVTESVVAGDLNGDGRPDLASANTFIDGPPPHPGHVSVSLQSQSSPGAFRGAQHLDAGSDTVMVAIGDLNGDTLMDLVAANDASDSISILFQNSSSPGTFLAPRNVGVGNNPNGVAIGDLNGDGHPDLAVADSRLSVLFQNPGAPGTFFPPITLGVSCSSVGIGDLNADGRADLVATRGNVRILLQDPATAGTFLPPQTVAAGFQPINVAIADLNADGQLDLAIANLGTPDNPATASLSVLLNNPVSPGTFLTATDYATGDRSQSVSIGDLNGDGKPDLAVANAGAGGNTGSVSILFQNPGAPGTFRSAVNRPGTFQPLGVAIADLNEDNFLDIALADDGVRILFQIPSQPGTFRTPILVGN